MSDDKYGDIVGELLREANLLPEGLYEGTLEESWPIQETKTTGNFYIKTMFKIRDFKVFIYFGGPTHTLKFMEHALSKYKGTTVQVKIKHREYNQQWFHQGEVKKWEK